MPRVELRDRFGYCVQVSTLSRDTLRTWLTEWLPRFYPAAEAQPMVMVMVWPLFDERKLPDWVTDSRLLGRWEPIPANPYAAMEALDALRKRLEHEQEELMNRGR